MGHVGIHGPRFGARDIRTQNNYQLNNQKPVETDEGWDKQFIKNQ